MSSLGGPTLKKRKKKKKNCIRNIFSGCIKPSKNVQRFFHWTQNIILLKSLGVMKSAAGCRYTACIYCLRSYPLIFSSWQSTHAKLSSLEKNNNLTATFSLLQDQVKVYELHFSWKCSRRAKLLHFSSCPNLLTWFFVHFKLQTTIYLSAI